MKEHSQKYLQQRKFLSVLPVIVFPFLALVFWLLGGGTEGKEMVSTKTGLNMQLPDANSKAPSALDKLSFYAIADRDSLKRREQLMMDPNYRSKHTSGNILPEGNDELLKPKIERLEKQVAQPDYFERPVKKTVVESPEEIDRLQMMVQSISQKKSDPDIEALNGTLDKLLEMQNPGRGKKERIKDTRDKVFAVTSSGSGEERSYFGAGSLKAAHSFLADLDEHVDSVKAGVIIAVVHSEQVLVAGSVVKLRLLQDVFVNGERIPAGSFVFGNSSINQERLTILVPSIQFQNRLFPVALSVFDMDGLEGIHIPGSAGREVLKQSADQGIQSVSGLSFDPSLKAQVAAAGINATKSIFSKKVKQERVTVKAGYKVLLKDENEKSN